MIMIYNILYDHNICDSVPTMLKNSVSKTKSDRYRSVQICIFVMQASQIYVTWINVNVSECSVDIHFVQ